MPAATAASAGGGQAPTMSETKTPRLARWVAAIEHALFAHRAATLAALVALTLVMGVFAAQLRIHRHG